MATKRKKITKNYTKTAKNVRQHPKHFLKVYWPYIPVIILVVIGVFFTNVNPYTQKNSPSTLAYATEMSVSGLLAATNAERANNGLSPLTINTKLNASAQSKANDMVARNYWAHNTPDGQEPWIFFDAAGYEYQKAGENLAYGFSNSQTTIVGWMNSPSHRANMLDSLYTEVGFGFANSENFVSTGQETIIVAHYAKPITVTAAPAPTPAPVAASSPQQKPQSLPAAETKPTPEPVVQETIPQEVVEDTVVASNPEPRESKNQPVTSDTPVANDKESTTITRIQRLTGGSAPWSAVVVTVVAFSVVIVWLLKHALLVKRFIMQGEHFVAHHPLFDLLVISVAALAIYLSQTSGIVL